jgi:hypothetical protein
MFSVLYHAMLKFPNFHRVVENVGIKIRVETGQGFGRKKGLGFQVWALMHSRRSLAFHLAASPRSSLLTAKDHTRPGPTNVSLDRHWYISQCRNFFFFST